MSSEEKRLEPLRKRIDALDQQLIDLLSERAKCALEVGHIKGEYGSPVFRPEREQQVLNNVATKNSGPLKNQGIRAIWQEIMSACRDIEATVSVAFLGPVGTFSEEAMFGFFGKSITPLACNSLDEIFRMVESGQADYGITPIENSAEGVISRTLDLLLDSPLTISGEISIPIQHALLHATGKLEKVTRVLAHAQALAQCQQWLNTNLPHAQRIAVSSNAEAARQVAGDETAVAIASVNAAKEYQLQVVQESIQDDLHNRTRFVVIGRQHCLPSGHDQTSLILSVVNQPGAVYHLLAPLAEHDVSMVRFESRPARKGTWEYYFFVDVIGHESDPQVQLALDKLKTVAAFYKSLGSYPQSKTI